MTENKADKIKSQVEFYFSDANFRVDKFLKEQSLINEGWIDLNIIASFNKLRELEATIDDIKEALKDSKIVEFKDNSIKKVITKEYNDYVENKEISKNFVHIAGFPKECSLEDIKSMLKQYCEPLLIRMRRDKAKYFNGSVFAELSSYEEVEKLLNAQIPVKKTKEVKEDDEEAAKKQKVEEKYLVITKKDDFVAEEKKKTEEKKNKKEMEDIAKEFGSKIFKYKSKSDLNIASIKNMVPGASFVDINEKVIRMKEPQEGNSLKFEKDGAEIKLNKIEGADLLEYCKKINTGGKKKKFNKKNKN